MLMTTPKRKYSDMDWCMAELRTMREKEIRDKKKELHWQNVTLPLEVLELIHSNHKQTVELYELVKSGSWNCNDTTTQFDQMILEEEAYYQHELSKWRETHPKLAHYCKAPKDVAPIKHIRWSE